MAAWVAEIDEITRPDSAPNVRSLTSSVLRRDGMALRPDAARTLRELHHRVHRAQIHLRLFRPVIDQSWLEEQRRLLRDVNARLHDLALLDDPDLEFRLGDRWLGARSAAFEDIRRDVWSESWAELCDTLESGAWPVRNGRFDDDEPAHHFLPGQLRPLLRKLRSLRSAPGTEIDIRLVAKTTARLEAGFQLLSETGRREAAVAAAACSSLLAAIETTVQSSRQAELLTTLGVTPPDVAAAPEGWRESIARVIAHDGVARTPADAQPVRAGGAVIWRRSGGVIEVVVVRTERDLGWSLPKGKCAAGESYLDGALREAFEETGLVCHVGDELLDANYRDRAGRAKHVRYWSMRPAEGELRAAGEVVEVAWLEYQEAIRTITRDRERRVLASLAVDAESVP